MTTVKILTRRNLLHKLGETHKHLTSSTRTAYVSRINAIYNEIGQTKLKFYKDIKKTKKYLNSLTNLNNRKNKTVAIVAFIRANEKPDKADELVAAYQDVISNTQQKIRENREQQKGTQKDKDNFATIKEINDLQKKLEKNVNSIKLTKHSILSPDALKIVQDDLILSMFLWRPLRNDYATFEIIKMKAFRKLAKKKQNDNNYLVVSSINKKVFVLNKYKTAKTHGPIVFEPNAKINKKLNKWLIVNTTNHLLINPSNKTKMKMNGFSQYLIRLFKKHLNKRIGTSRLRSIMITDELKNDKTIAENKELNKRFLNTQEIRNLRYRKIDMKT